MADVFSFSEERFVLVAKIAKPHGLRGEVKLHAYSDSAETLLHYQHVILVDAKGSLSPVLEIEKARMQGKVAVLKLETVNDRETAESIHGRGVLIEKADLPEVVDGEYYWHQLYNLPVVTETGRVLGCVKSIFSNGAQDVMVISDGDQEYLIPIIETIVLKQSDKEIVISPPPGLLEINTGIDD